MQESRALKNSLIVSSPDQKGSYKTDSQFEEDKDHTNVQYSADDESDPLRTRGPLRKFRGIKKSFDEDSNLINCGVSGEMNGKAKGLASQRLQFFSNPCILRVKRKREEDALDQIYLEFDKQSGDLKKTKVVTEMQAIQAKLSFFGLDRQQEEQKKSSPQQNEQDYAIGKPQAKGEQQPSQPVLRLTKLRMPGTSAMALQMDKEGGEGQIKEYCLNVINTKREQRRKDIIKEQRVVATKFSSGTDQMLTEKQEEKVNQSIEDVKIIDFKEILKGKESDEVEEALNDQDQQKETLTKEEEEDEDDQYVHDYYILDLEDQLASYNGNNTPPGDTLMHDIVKGGDDQLEDDHDSEDSNRESGDDKSYPDERSSFDEDDQNSSAEEDYDNYQHHIGKKGKHSSDDDEERAAQRYNAKSNKSIGQLQNRIINNLLEHPKKTTVPIKKDLKQKQSQQQHDQKDDLLGYIPRIPEGSESDDHQMQH